MKCTVTPERRAACSSAWKTGSTPWRRAATKDGCSARQGGYGEGLGAKRWLKNELMSRSGAHSPRTRDLGRRSKSRVVNRRAVPSRGRVGPLRPLSAQARRRASSHPTNTGRTLSRCAESAQSRLAGNRSGDRARGRSAQCRQSRAGERPASAPTPTPRRARRRYRKPCANAPVPGRCRHDRRVQRRRISCGERLDRGANLRLGVFRLLMKKRKRAARSCTAG